MFVRIVCTALAVMPFMVFGDAINDFMEMYAHHVKNNPVVLDCGAFKGYSSLDLLKVFPEGRVLAVEADPDIFEELVDKTKDNRSIDSYNYALCGKNGYTTFYENENKSKAGQQGSIYPESKTNWYWRKIHLKDSPIQVPSRTLDSFCAENGINRIDLMYLDMQGAEYEMIECSEKIIETTNVIITEVCFEEIYKGIHLYHDMCKLLEKLGFKQVVLIKRHKSWGDAVFVRIRNNKKEGIQ